MSKQGELKGMPPKTEAQKQAEYFISVWEEVQTKKANLKVAKDNLMPAMKREKLNKISVTDSTGIKRRIEYDEKETITVKEDKG